jgi:four helix bundle protein
MGHFTVSFRKHACLVSVMNTATSKAASSAANYAEARGAESHGDFVHKLGVVLKERNETVVWLELIVEGSMVSDVDVVGIIAENRELCRIITASVKTARAPTDP